MSNPIKEQLYIALNSKLNDGEEEQVDAIRGVLPEISLQDAIILRKDMIRHDILNCISSNSYSNIYNLYAHTDEFKINE